MQMIFVEHFIGRVEDGSACLVDFDSPTTFYAQLLLLQEIFQMNQNVQKYLSAQGLTS